MMNPKRTDRTSTCGIHHSSFIITKPSSLRSPSLLLNKSRPIAHLLFPQTRKRFRLRLRNTKRFF
ncbi:MAG TPA: hypothetical protein ENJ53_07730, partial [Phaeodactylibacter sp.]|nr:hypothetical protein [Phaeodactylibacter sp.]